MSGRIDATRESKIGQAVIRAHQEYFELAGIILTRHEVEGRSVEVPGVGTLTSEPFEVGVPVLLARLGCSHRPRHVIGYVAKTTLKADAVIYLKQSESLDDIRDHAAQTFPDSFDPDWDPRGSAGLKSARAVTRYLDPVSDGQPQPPAWCPRCGDHVVDLGDIRRRRAVGLVEIGLERS